MQYKERNQRLRLLVRKLNQQRKAQAKQIDILCNDIIGMHRDLINTLNKLAFAADFCESLLGYGSLQHLLAGAAEKIYRRIGNCKIVFFLSIDGQHQAYAFGDNEDTYQIEQHFTPELIENITRANKLCNLEELLTMGLQVKPILLKNISAVTVPIAGTGPTSGFILLYRTSPTEPIQSEQLEFLSIIRRALSRAIWSYITAAQPDG